MGVKDLPENVQRGRKRLANSHCAALRRNLEGRQGRSKMSAEPKGAREKTGTHTDIKAFPLTSLLSPGLKSDQTLLRAGQGEADQGLFTGALLAFLARQSFTMWNVP